MEANKTSHNIHVAVEVPIQAPKVEATFGPTDGGQQNVPNRDEKTTDDTQSVAHDVVQGDTVVPPGGAEVADST
jgi:hypothetical protein